VNAVVDAEEHLPPNENVGRNPLVVAFTIFSNVVPASVPSLRQSCVPFTPSLAAKITTPGVSSTKSVTFDPAVPPLMSRRRCVLPASRTHGSGPLISFVATKNNLPPLSRNALGSDDWAFVEPALPRSLTRYGACAKTRAAEMRRRSRVIDRCIGPWIARPRATDPLR
jgi:hypothetical protein